MSTKMFPVNSRSAAFPAVSTHELPAYPRLETSPKDYQDEDESRDSKFKTIWDRELKNELGIAYRKAFVLLLSWHKDVDDLNTGNEVHNLNKVFQEIYKYQTVQKVLERHKRKTAQSQVNRHLAEFVDEYDDTETLLIIYYAGHGRPGEPGILHLTGQRSLHTEEKDVHEVIWSSAEQNIKDTRGDVLLIFDCCHAAELEKSNRGFKRRAFEYLAATSAKSTTRAPGKHSFTSALIWSLENLAAKGEGFTTSKLICTISNDAPDFPKDQEPRLSERHGTCLRRIVLAPLTGNETGETCLASGEKIDDTNCVDVENANENEVSIRFVFDKDITPELVTQLASAVGSLKQQPAINAKAVLWEGVNRINVKDSAQSYLIHMAANQFRKSTRQKRKAEASPSNESKRPKLPMLIADNSLSCELLDSPARDDPITPADITTHMVEPKIAEDPLTSDKLPTSLTTTEDVPLSGKREPETNILNPTSEKQKMEYGANDGVAEVVRS